MNSELFRALEAGNLDEIQGLHRQNRDVLLDRTFEGDTALHIAARKGHLNLVTWILSEKPSLADARNKVKKTPLHEAAKSGNLNLVKILLQHKQSCICLFIKFRFRDLLELYANTLLFTFVPEPHTALEIATQYRHLGIVELLLEAKSSEYQVAASEWHRCLGEAAYRGYGDVVVALLNKKRSTLDQILNIWKTPILHRAVEGGHLDTVVALLNHPAWWRNDLMRKKDKYGRCAIHVAAIKGRWEMIKEFISRMPDSVQIRGPNQKSVLQCAVEYDQFDVVKYLLENKGREEAEEMVSYDYDCSHNTALHLASTNGVSPELLDLLLSFRGDNVNALNNEGMTTLDIASALPQESLNRANIIQKLEAAGAMMSSHVRKSSTSTFHTLYRSEKGIDKDTVNSHMVVASLIATITFAAILATPGGIEDDKESIHYGAAKLAFHKVFKLFLFSDSVAFLSSLTVVVGLLLQQQLKDNHSESSVALTIVMSNFSEACLLVSIITTVLAFVTATILVIIPHNLDGLKSKDKKVFSKYKLLWQTEVSLAVMTPLFIGLILRSASAIRMKKMFGNFVQMCFILAYLMLMSFVLSGVRN